MARTWVLVAESSRAKLYAAESNLAPLSELEDLVHPAGRMHEGDLVSDRAGNDGGSVGQGRHVMNDKTSARDYEKIEFARQIAERLDTACAQGSFERLVLIAPPTFLGVLRDRLSKRVMERVSKQIDKNLVQKPAEVVREHITMTV